MGSLIKYTTLELLHDSKLYMAYYKDNVDIDLSKLQLSPTDSVIADSIQSKKRKTEFLTVRALFSEILPLEKIIYSATGAPLIESNSCQISISHSSACVAILISPHECGVDIEDLSRNFSTAAKKFITDNDAIVRSEMDLAAVWATKEAIYKAYKGVDINIYSDIVIKHLGEKQITCSIRGQSVISRILIIDSLIISYVNILNIK